ncbi:MAG: YolD-like family protein [Lachnospiraceae bacterium]|nr:YolD-like family protein [Lachnospiraceae bacterium]
MKNYDDIINLPHHTSKKHPRLSKEQRAAQFSSFAALTGFEDDIKETARLTDTKPELSESEKQVLDDKLEVIRMMCTGGPREVVKVTYFVKDDRKEGGRFVNKTGQVVKIDEIARAVVFDDKNRVKIEDIVDITLDLFENIMDNQTNHI